VLFQLTVRANIIAN